jgi:MtN3 and saliva related transmembrane protein
LISSIQTIPALAIAFPRTGSPMELIGFIAAFCTTAAFVPQLVRVLRLKSAHEISLPTFLLYSIGIFFWLVYGIDTGSRPIIASNSISLGISLSILYLKFKHDRNATKEL